MFNVLWCVIYLVFTVELRKSLSLSFCYHVEHLLDLKCDSIKCCACIFLWTIITREYGYPLRWSQQYFYNRLRGMGFRTTLVWQWPLAHFLCCHGYDRYAQEFSIVHFSAVVYQPTSWGCIKWHVPYYKIPLLTLYMAAPPVDVLAPNGARPSTDTMLTTKSQMFLMIFPL